jgi:hypothetical protein
LICLSNFDDLARKHISTLIELTGATVSNYFAPLESEPQPQPVVLSVDGGLLLVSYHPLANILQAT